MKSVIFYSRIFFRQFIPNIFFVNCNFFPFIENQYALTFLQLSLGKKGQKISILYAKKIKTKKKGTSIGFFFYRRRQLNFYSC